MMNINVKSQLVYNTKFVCTAVYCSEFKVIFFLRFCSRFVTSTTEICLELHNI